MNFESKKADDDGVKVLLFCFLEGRKAKRTMGFVAFVVRSREPSGNESQN
jgi:hypothetical protein